MEKLLLLVVTLFFMQYGGIAQNMIFPFLNSTKITMLDEHNNPIEGFFTMPPKRRSGVEMDKKLSAIEYFLYTRKQPGGVTIRKVETLSNTTFDREKPVKFITHGWQSSGKADTCEEIKNGYLTNADVNVIVVDWKEIADDPFYVNSMFAVPDVSRHLASLVNHMIEKMKVDPKRIHLIGHSLGAQISGLVWKNMHGGKLGRVTGLDPAYPGFDHIVMFNDRISNDSAEFVDIIHSCAGILGLPNSVGHVDFYPNGGCSTQPGCESVFEACSHGRSWQYFADSVQYPNRTFHAFRCDSWEHYKSNNCENNEEIAMGEGTPTTARGNFYLKTNAHRPFARID